MKVLILGGTGAMGVPLQKELLNLGCEVHVTSRSRHVDTDIRFHCGDAHDIDFLSDVLLSEYDAIVDFMSYSTEEFKERSETILSNTSHYVFLSSSRVYSQCEDLITEDSARLLDVCRDDDYLKTNEYALSKAKQENILYDSKQQNWTIVRPSLTYNSERLQYALGEKEDWLFRYLHNDKIVFPSNMKDIYTTMSYGNDVARAISLLIGNERAIGETVHIAGAPAITWGEVNDVYTEVLKNIFHRTPEYIYIEDWEQLSKRLGNYYQLKYARSFSRKFDNSKLNRLVGNIEFTHPSQGLKLCLEQFVSGKMTFKSPSARREAYYNRITGDRDDLSLFSAKDKIKYIINRYLPIKD